jgi:hypothetical protein
MRSLQAQNRQHFISLSVLQRCRGGTALLVVTSKRRLHRTTTQHNTMKHPLYSFVLVFMATVGYGQCAHLRAAGAKSMELSRERVLFKTITTSECGNIHQEPFKGMLTLNYEYIVDTVQGAALDVAAIEMALVQAVVSSLSACDSYDRPMYAVQLTTASHKISPQGEFQT